MCLLGRRLGVAWPDGGLASSLEGKQPGRDDGIGCEHDDGAGVEGNGGIKADADFVVSGLGRRCRLSR